MCGCEKKSWSIRTCLLWESKLKHCKTTPVNGGRGNGMPCSPWVSYAGAKPLRRQAERFQRHDRSREGMAHNKLERSRNLQKTAEPTSLVRAQHPAPDTCPHRRHLCPLSQGGWERTCEIDLFKNALWGRLVWNWHRNRINKHIRVYLRLFP